MTPYFTDEHLTVYLGDCREVMASMEPESVHCVVTSPPYWGLRDYGVSGQLGLEPTPEAYVENLVAVFREVRRVLRANGTVWLNLGDCYATGAGSYRNPGSDVRPIEHGGKQAFTRDYARAQPNRMPIPGLKPKDLVGIPWRVAFALQADGWWLRRDIIWNKPNPMPESVEDRPTTSHEYLFLLSKSARYYFDAESVAEDARYSGPNGAQHSPYGQGFTRRSEQRTVQLPVKAWMDAGLDVEIRAPEPPTWAERKAAGATAGNVGVSETYQNGVHGEGLSHELGDGGLSRNIRSVWTIATQPYPGAHFATFPQKLVEPCVKAGCPEGGVVLDPFAGSGTTGLVAQRLGRRAVLIDLSADYLGQVMERNAQKPLGLAG